MANSEALNFTALMSEVEVVYDGVTGWADTVVDQALNDAVLAAKACNKEAELIIKFRIKPVNGNSSRAAISAAITTKKPEPSAIAKTVWVDGRGKLLLEEPGQQKLFAANTVATIKGKEGVA